MAQRKTGKRRGVGVVSIDIGPLGRRQHLVGGLGGAVVVGVGSGRLHRLVIARRRGVEGAHHRDLRADNRRGLWRTQGAVRAPVNIEEASQKETKSNPRDGCDKWFVHDLRLARSSPPEQRLFTTRRNQTVLCLQIGSKNSN